MDLTNTCILVDHLVGHLDNRERPGQQVTVYLPKDLILSARSELKDFILFTKSELEELQDTGRVREKEGGK